MSRPRQPRRDKRITDLTRREILDKLALDRIPWSGRLTEVEFLNRLYDLEALPSTDHRYRTAAGDIHQHRVNNHDWEDDWVFHDPRFELNRGTDEKLLTFLAEMLHPVVARSDDEAAKMSLWINDLLRPDGFELVVTASISGRPIYKGQRREAFHGARPLLGLDQRPVLTNTTVLHEHLDRIAKAVGRDPGAVIGSSKEIVESLCKLILDGNQVRYSRGEDLLKLYNKVADLLALKAEAVPSNRRGSESAHRILRALVTTIQNLSELRNEIGLGHGRNAPNPALERHARLSLNAAVTVTEFLAATWQDRVDTGLLAAERE